MKGSPDPVELSLLGIAKALKQDVQIDLEEKARPPKCRVKFNSETALNMREASRERTFQDATLPPEKFNAQGRVITGKMPVLYPIGFKKGKNGEIILTEGTHCMIAGNFTTVFGGANCAECAAAYDKVVAEGRTVWMTPTLSQNGKWWMNFSIE